MAEFPLVGLAAEDDGLHIATGDPWWREAWYFEFYDPRVNVQFQAYQGVFRTRKRATCAPPSSMPGTECIPS